MNQRDAKAYHVLVKLRTTKEPLPIIAKFIHFDLKSWDEKKMLKAYVNSLNNRPVYMEKPIIQVAKELLDCAKENT